MTSQQNGFSRLNKCRLTRMHYALLLFIRGFDSRLPVNFVLLGEKIYLFAVKKYAQIILSFFCPGCSYRQIANLSREILIMLLTDLARDFSDDKRHLCTSCF
jgi:hypothetical protein